MAAFYKMPKADVTYSLPKLDAEDMARIQDLYGTKTHLHN